MVYADEQDLLVLDGRDGTIMLRQDARSSPTQNEFATVADVDGDGSAEILFTASSGGETPLYLVGAPDAAWSAAGSVFAQRASWPGSRGAGLSLGPGGPSADGFRAVAALGPGVVPVPVPEPAPDLALAAWGPCPDEWNQGITFWIQVWNEGAAPTAQPSRAVVRGTEADGEQVEVAGVDVPILAAGESLPVEAIHLFNFSYAGFVQLRVAVTTEGECHVADGVAEIPLPEAEGG